MDESSLNEESDEEITSSSNEMTASDELFNQEIVQQN